MSDVKRGPVHEGKLIHLAVTGVARFNVDEEGCPSAWFYDAVERRPRVEKPWHTTGTDSDDQVNHYLEFDQDVLGRITGAGRHILPSPGKDLLVQWGLNNKRREKKPDGRWKNFFPPEESKLWAAGVPFVGFPDLINPREEYLVPSDDTARQTIELRKEPGVIEVLDNKTTSDFRWATPSDKLITKTQMNGYGMFIVNIEPAVVGVRLSHNIYRTDAKRAPAAIKRSVLVSAKEIRDRWTSVVEPIVEQMKSVAGTKRDVDVPYNLSACDSFGGCSHRDYCHAQKKLNPFTRMKMSSLLKNRGTNGAAAAVPNGTNTPWIPPAAPVPPPAAALPIMQQMAPPPPPAMAPAAPAQAAPVMAVPPPPAAPVVMAPPPPQAQGPMPMLAGAAVQNQRYFVNGQLMQYLCSTGGQQSFMPVVNGQMQAPPVLVPYEAQIFDASGVMPAMPQASVASPPAAPAVPAAPAPVAAAEPEKRGRGRPKKLKVDYADEAAAQASAAAPAAPVPVAPAPAPVVTAAVSGVTEAKASGITLFINSVPNVPFIDLSSYVTEIVEDMQNQFGVPDIRVGSGDSALGFGKWKGVLAGCVRAEPPAPGVYAAFTKGSEFTEVAVEALWPMASPGSARAF